MLVFFLVLGYSGKEYMDRASLVAQWLSVCLSIQGMRVRALVWEDPRATERLGP